VPHNIDLILTFTGGLAAALVLGYLTERIKLSPIVGYLLAGVLIGPFTPGYVANTAIAEQFAEVGVILLMFGVGIHFDLKDLFAVRKVALPGALSRVTTMPRSVALTLWMHLGRPDDARLRTRGWIREMSDLAVKGLTRLARARCAQPHGEGDQGAR
jgi:predicted Kef-type K+ transport protein